MKLLFLIICFIGLIAWFIGPMPRDSALKLFHLNGIKDSLQHNILNKLIEQKKNDSIYSIKDTIKISSTPVPTLTAPLLKPVITQSLAPTATEKLNKLSTQAYIKKYAYIAKNEALRASIPASITMAQALIESNSGNSVLAIKNNNHFGLKCFSKNCQSGHCTNFTDDSHKDFFRKYHTPEESFKAHSDLLSNNHYGSLKANKSYISWAYGLQQKHYATDPLYAKKIIKTIETYNLQLLDN